MLKSDLLFTFILIVSVFPSEFYPFRFSVIMAVYNTARYLNDSIWSVLNQSCGFNKIQLIIINDGSLDNSDELCMKYMSQYPHNIIYRKIKHGGVSNARNIGLGYAEGKYINFLDSDDKWDTKAFAYVLNFYKQHQEVDLVAGRIKFFEARNSYHILDYKFKKTRVVNLFEKYNYIQLHASSCFFRLKTIQNLKFNIEIKYSEDTLFINTLLLYKPKIGFIREALYNYRRRNDESSAIQTVNKDQSFYFDTIFKVHYFLMKLSILLYRKIVPFIQCFLVYDIQFRIKVNARKLLNYFNFIKYKKIINTILNNIDDYIILEQKYITNIIKLLILSKKYRKDLRNNLTFEDIILYLKIIFFIM